MISGLTLSGCAQQDTQLNDIKKRGKLRVLTQIDPVIFYPVGGGYSGLEYDLITRFADEIGVDVEFVTDHNFSDMLSMVSTGKADIAAVNLTITDARQDIVRFSPPYQQVTEQLVYRRGESRPRKPEDLAGHTVEVVAGSSHAETMRRLHKQYPDINLVVREDLTMQEILARVESGEIDYALTDSTILARSKRYFPALRAAFDITGALSIAWAIQRSDDNTLYKAIDKFMQHMHESGELAFLKERYYGYTKRLNYVDRRTFHQHVVTRLPKYQAFFQEAANEYERDWKLLAAIGYQESHWDPKATSPTGVQGIMMLTRDTAKEVGLKNRRDPRGSIMGGAAYLEILEDKIPDRIAEPDRLWLALAGYNIGFGHLEDARRLTQGAGDNPDRWVDVKKHLPLLNKPSTYKKTRYGFARGAGAVQYVDQIRAYYDMLKWIDREEKRKEMEALSAQPLLYRQTPAPVEEIDIDDNPEPGILDLDNPD